MGFNELVEDTLGVTLYKISRGKFDYRLMAVVAVTERLSVGALSSG